MAQISKLSSTEKFFWLPFLSTTLTLMILMLFDTCNLSSSFPLDENSGQNGYDYNDIAANRFETSAENLHRNLTTRVENKAGAAVAVAYEGNALKYTNGIQYELKTTEATMPTIPTTIGTTDLTWPTMPTTKTTWPPTSGPGDPEANKHKFQPLYIILIFGLIVAIIPILVACTNPKDCAICMLLRKTKKARPPSDDHAIEISVIRTPAPVTVTSDRYPELSRSTPVSYQRPGPDENQPGEEFADNPPPYPCELSAQNLPHLSPEPAAEEPEPPSYETLQKLLQLPVAQAQESSCTGSRSHPDGSCCFCANCNQVRQPNNANLPNGGFRS